MAAAAAAACASGDSLVRHRAQHSARTRARLVQVSAEIAERQQFLEQMRAMGKGEEHEGSIRLQVAERMSELGTLERMMREE